VRNALHNFLHPGPAVAQFSRQLVIGVFAVMAALAGCGLWVAGLYIVLARATSPLHALLIIGGLLLLASAILAAILLRPKVQPASVSVPESQSPLSLKNLATMAIPLGQNLLRRHPGKALMLGVLAGVLAEFLTDNPRRDDDEA
jgi:hypothetical protein